MPPITEQNTDPKSLETRFGLVMYGGVSLAIYINGVAQEFYRAVRGRGVYKLVKSLIDSDIVVDIVSGTSAGGINGVMLAYALCNKKEFSKAGNLWRNDGDIRRLLRSPHGTVETSWSLLNSEGYYQPQLESAFREMQDIKQEVIDEELPSEFKELDLFVTGTDVDGRRFTQFDDAGHPIDVKDHRVVFLLKHRSGRKEPFNPTWESRARNGVARKPDPEATFRALAKLSRLTSCFPAAFSPVTVTKPEAGGDAADELLQTWGAMGRETCFLDGGLIDNKPFTHTLGAIFFRPAERRIDRKLFYVEPDPEHWEEIVNASQPNFAQAIFASLVGIPGYESISDDLKLLANHNSKLERYRRMVSFLDGKGESEPPSPQAKQLYRRSRLIALSERIIHGVMRTSGRDELLDKETRETGAELVKEFEQVVTKMLNEDSSLTNEEHEKLRAMMSRKLTSKIVSAQLASGGDQERMYEEVAAVLAPFPKEYETARARLRPLTMTDWFLDNFDADFGLRRLFRTVYFIELQLRDEKKTREAGDFAFELMGDGGAVERLKIPRATQYRKLWRLLNTQIALHDIIRAAMEKAIDESEFVWRKRAPSDVWKDALGVQTNILYTKTSAAKLLPSDFTCSPKENSPEWLSPELLKQFNEEIRRLAERIAEVTVSKQSYVGKESDDTITYSYGRVVDKEDKGGEFSSIFSMVGECEKKMVEQLLPDEGDPVRRVYEDFETLDAKLYPVEFIAELNEKDTIKTVRISPYDARKGFSNKGLSDKVSGDEFYHFGGFFKRSWRSNDILWGRLDCLCQLVETLVTPDRLEVIESSELLRRKVRERFYETTPDKKYVLREDWKPERIFPYAGETDVGQLAELARGASTGRRLFDGKRPGRREPAKSRSRASAQRRDRQQDRRVAHRGGAVGNHQGGRPERHHRRARRAGRLESVPNTEGRPERGQRLAAGRGSRKRSSSCGGRACCR